MAGIYLHIPFCESRCTYCDFFSTTSKTKIPELVQAIKKELWYRRDYLDNERIETIYFGGGTPSLLHVYQIRELMQALFSVFQVDHDAEITLESNPDDLSVDYLIQLRNLGINRLSIGIQSFVERDLMLMNRRHSAQQAQTAVSNARAVGFDNISIGLIYGVPGLSMEEWTSNLESAFDLNVQHLSAYHLTYHENTLLFNYLKKGIISELKEEESVKQFELLIDAASKHGFEHYEISNFAKNQLYSKHNTSYWQQKKYLGLGPSAHSFNGDERSWNISNLKKYIDGIHNNNFDFETEVLQTKEKINDFIITSLRTVWGLNLNSITDTFGENYVHKIFNSSKAYIDNGFLTMEQNTMKLSKKGIFISDKIMSDLMIEI